MLWEVPAGIERATSRRTAGKVLNCCNWYRATVLDYRDATAEYKAVWSARVCAQQVQVTATGTGAMPAGMAASSKSVFSTIHFVTRGITQKP